MINIKHETNAEQKLKDDKTRYKRKIDKKNNAKEDKSAINVKDKKNIDYSDKDNSDKDSKTNVKDSKKDVIVSDKSNKTGIIKSNKTGIIKSNKTGIIKSNKTGIVYDDNKHMIRHIDNGPESGRRIKAIMKKLKQIKLFDPELCSNGFASPDKGFELCSVFLINPSGPELCSNGFASPGLSSNGIADQELKSTLYSSEDKLDSDNKNDNNKNICIIPSRIAKLDELSLFHTMDHISYVSTFSTSKTNDNPNHDGIYKTGKNGDTIEYNTHTTLAASIAAGSTCEIVEAVLQGKCRNGFAIVRPPGHHANNDCADGFCVYNNIVIAAKLALHKYKLNRILIVDWDIHHGNGTQAAFYDDPRVLYFSIHRYDHGSFYPFSKDASYTRIGYDKGRGFNVNVPWDISGDCVGDKEYKYVFEKLLLPLAREFKPELILVSAGFDAAVGDPLGNCNVTPEGFAYMTDSLMNLFSCDHSSTHVSELDSRPVVIQEHNSSGALNSLGGQITESKTSGINTSINNVDDEYQDQKIVLVLEGGYNLDIIGDCVASCLRVLMNNGNRNVDVKDVEIDSRDIKDGKIDSRDIKDGKSDNRDIKDNKSFIKSENKSTSESSRMRNSMKSKINTKNYIKPVHPNAIFIVDCVIDELAPFWKCFGVKCDSENKVYSDEEQDDVE